jgi:hypothetical protein
VVRVGVPGALLPLQVLRPAASCQPVLPVLNTHVVKAIKWGLSPLDWRRHAVDERRDHPIGVYVAQCGHLLLMVTPLLSEPAGSRCEACTRARDADNTSSAPVER